MLITRIVDRSLPFGGTWIYTLVPDGGSTPFLIVEDGEVYNRVFRLISRFVVGHDSTIELTVARRAKTSSGAPRPGGFFGLARAVFPTSPPARTWLTFRSCQACAAHAV